MCLFSVIHFRFKKLSLQYIMVTLYVYYVYIAYARIHFLEVAMTLNKCCLECKTHALAPHKVWLQIKREAVKINVNLLCSKNYPSVILNTASKFVHYMPLWLFAQNFRLDSLHESRSVTKIKPFLTGSDLFDTLKNQWPLIQASVLAVAPLVSYQQTTSCCVNPSLTSIHPIHFHIKLCSKYNCRGMTQASRQFCSVQMSTYYW